MEGGGLGVTAKVQKSGGKKKKGKSTNLVMLQRGNQQVLTLH